MNETNNENPENLYFNGYFRPSRTRDESYSLINNLHIHLQSLGNQYKHKKLYLYKLGTTTYLIKQGGYQFIEEGTNRNIPISYSDFLQNAVHLDLAALYIDDEAVWTIEKYDTSRITLRKRVDNHMISPNFDTFLHFFKPLDKMVKLRDIYKYVTSNNNSFFKDVVFSVEEIRVVEDKEHIICKDLNTAKLFVLPLKEFLEHAKSTNYISEEFSITIKDNKDSKTYQYSQFDEEDSKFVDLVDRIENESGELVRIEKENGIEFITVNFELTQSLFDNYFNDKTKPSSPSSSGNGILF